MTQQLQCQLPETGKTHLQAAPVEMLNLGCGQRFHAEWVNVDFVSGAPAVIAHDLRKGIPFEDGRFALVYHSHVLEHFEAQDGARFLHECHRVARKGGLIRVAIPDLERIAATYLEALSRAMKGEQAGAGDYAWIKLELFDQMTRGEPGGLMRRYLENPQIPNPEFVVERLGVEARRLMKREGATPGVATRPSRVQRPSIYRRIRERCIRWLLGAEYSTLQMGRFRRGGEIHLWMYDRFSLAQALEEAGYSNPRVCKADTSAFPGLSRYGLDIEPDGSTYKPDSLFMEAHKL